MPRVWRVAVTSRLAILAPTFGAARFEARERELRESQWFFVESERSVLGRSPGQFVVRMWPDARLMPAQVLAAEYMEHCGWLRVGR